MTDRTDRTVPVRSDRRRSDRILTVPNLLSTIRLLGVPLFAYLLLVTESDGWALIVLLVGGGTDWLDGKLARLLDQYSTLGAILDPLIDRIYLVSVLLCFALRDLLPWWLVALLFLREVLLAVSLGAYRRRDLAPPEVLYIGKAATFALMVALPMVLLGTLDTVVRHTPEFGGVGVVAAVARALLWWGTALYLWSGALYLWQAIRVARGAPVP